MPKLNVKFSESYRFEMPSNYANSLFHSRQYKFFSPFPSTKTLDLFKKYERNLAFHLSRAYIILSKLHNVKHTTCRSVKGMRVDDNLVS